VELSAQARGWDINQRDSEPNPQNFFSAFFWLQKSKLTVQASYLNNTYEQGLRY
jgi:hypothetical protein